MRTVASVLLSGCLFGPMLWAQDAAPSFHPPLRLSAGGSPIAVEGPGYAAPTWFDVDGDGKKDLVVGQFRDGKIQIFRQTGPMEFAAGSWLQADGRVANVPGVW